MTPTTIIGFALFVFAVALMLDRYKPTWIYRLSWWQVLIGLIAIIAALVIVATPEFYALGILGDSTFFDLLVLAIGIQLQVILAQAGVRILRGVKWTGRFVIMRIFLVCSILAFTVCEIVSSIHRVVHRLSL